MNTEEIKQKMQKVMEVLRVDISSVRTGRATPSLIENIVISAYDGVQRLRVMELATIAASDSQTLVITPFDNSILGEIQKGIQEANIGLNPSTDGQVIRISIPSLSEERRGQLIKLMHQKLEGGRIMVRQIRHEAMDDVKKAYANKEISEDEMVRLEKEIQKLTDDTTAEIESLGKKKEEELLQV